MPIRWWRCDSIADACLPAHERTTAFDEATGEVYGYAQPGRDETGLALARAMLAGETPLWRDGHPYLRMSYLAAERPWLAMEYRILQANVRACFGHAAEVGR